MPWQNPLNRRDVDATGQPDDPTPNEVLKVINFINLHPSIELPKPPSPLGPPPYVDVIGDGWVTPAGQDGQGLRRGWHTGRCPGRHRSRCHGCVAVIR